MDPATFNGSRPQEEIGETCMKMLLERLHHPQMAFSQRVLPTELIIRKRPPALATVRLAASQRPLVLIGFRVPRPFRPKAATDLRAWSTGRVVSARTDSFLRQVEMPQSSRLVRSQNSIASSH